MADTTVVLLTLILYKVVLLAVGWWASKRVSDDSDFFLASGGEGGGLGAWTAGLSYAASTSSAWVLLGFTGMVFTRCCWSLVGPGHIWRLSFNLVVYGSKTNR